MALPARQAKEGLAWVEGNNPPFAPTLTLEDAATADRDLHGVVEVAVAIMVAPEAARMAAAADHHFPVARIPPTHRAITVAQAMSK